MSHNRVPHDGLCRRGLSLLTTHLAAARERLHLKKLETRTRSAGKLEGMAARSIERMLSAMDGRLPMQCWPVADGVNIEVLNEDVVTVAWNSPDGSVDVQIKLPGEQVLGEKNRQALREIANTEQQLAKLQVMGMRLVEDLLVDVQLFTKKEDVPETYYQRLRELVEHVEEEGTLPSLELEHAI